MSTEVIGLPVHLLKPRGGSACGAENVLLHADINRVTCDKCSRIHDEAIGPKRVEVGQPMCPASHGDGHRPAEYLMPQGSPKGVTNWQLACEFHARTWWEGSDWLPKDHEGFKLLPIGVARRAAELLAEYRSAIAEHAPELEARLNDRAVQSIVELYGEDRAYDNGLL